MSEKQKEENSRRVARGTHESILNYPRGLCSFGGAQMDSAHSARGTSMKSSL